MYTSYTHRPYLATTDVVGDDDDNKDKDELMIKHDVKGGTLVRGVEGHEVRWLGVGSPTSFLVLF